jgi:hypothetical protein
MTQTIPRLATPPSGFNIFSGGQPCDLNACMNFMGHMGYGYVEGHREAMNVLIEHVARTLTDQDLLIYPILFLSRHHLELRLKSIIDLGNRIEGNGRSVPMIHNLTKLWEHCRPCLIEHTSPDDHEWFESIKEVMDQMTRFDSGADAFRFPTLRDHSKSLDGVHHINIARLYEVLDPVMTWLDYAEGYLQQIVDWQEESLASNQ